MTDVVVLTARDCDLCDHATGVLARLATEHDLDVRAVPLESPEGRDLAARAGATFPPVVFLDGAPYSYGRLSERRLRKTLAGHASTTEPPATTR